LVPLATSENNLEIRRTGGLAPGQGAVVNHENIRVIANTNYFAYNGFRGTKAMSDVLVCAEPEAREEASEFVSKLGARPQAWSRRFLKKRSEKEKVKGVFVYVAEGAGDLGMLRNCLKQLPKQSSWHVVVFSHPSSDHKSAELGKIVGEFRPRRTHICFDSQEVKKVFHADMRITFGRKKEDTNESLTSVREELDLTQVDVAAALDVTPRTVQNWESHGLASPRKYRDLKELRGLVRRYVQADQVAKWMDMPNDAFQKRTPRELIREGKTRDLVLEFERLQTGEPS
jgi:DNA-binding XRE family transcriptional regulator